MAKRDLVVNFVVKGAQQFEQQLGRFRGGLDKLDKKLGVVGRRIIGFMSVRAIKGQTDQAIESFSSLQESINATEVVFGDASQTIFDFSENAGEAAGLAKSEFNQMASEIGALLIGFGLDAETAADQTVILTQRAADMASVYNTDVSQALEAIQSGLTRQIRPLRRYAVNLEASRVAQKAVELGLADSTAEVSLNADAQARLAIIMEQTNIVRGDFVRTSDDYANSMRIANAEIENQRAVIGGALVPIYQEAKQFTARWSDEVAILAVEIGKTVGLIDEETALMAELRVRAGGAASETDILATAIGRVAEESNKDFTGGKIEEFIRFLDGTLPDFEASLKDLLLQSGVTANGLLLLINRSDFLAEAFGLTNEQVEILIRLLKGELQRQFLNTSRAASDDALIGYASAVDDVGESSEDAAEDVATLREEMVRLADPVFNAAKAAEEAEEAHREWAEAVDEFGQDSPEAQKAARDYALALMEAKVAGGQIDDDARDAFRNIMLDAGFALEWINALIAGFNELSTAGGLQGTPGTIIPMPGEGNQIEALHTGGEVTGGAPGSEVLRRLQVGERVTRRSEVGHSGVSTKVDIYLTDPSTTLIGELIEMNRRE